VKFNKKALTALVAALLSLLGAAKLFLDSLPDAPGPAAPSELSSPDAGAQ
jgi:hypothetical protein